MKNFLVLTLILSVISVASGYAEESSPFKDMMASCEDYPAMLEACQPYACTFVHPFTGTAMEKRIIGEKEGKCLTTEQMPNHGKMACAYTVDMRKAEARALRAFAAEGNAAAQAHTSAEEDSITSMYSVDGKEVDNPGQEALNNGQCVISGYE